MITRRVWLSAFVLLCAAACEDSQGDTTTASSAASSGASTSGSGSGSTGGGGSSGEGGGGEGGGAGQPVNVLFVGNSYIFVNDLPALVAGIDGGGPEVSVASVTVGGATLNDHLTTTGAVEQIASGGFSHVVVQGQSVEPLFQPAVFLAGASQLSMHINNAGALPVFFETWARAEGHDVYQESWSGGTPAAMQAGLRDAYQQAATDGGGVMAPVGDAWEVSLAQQPQLVLHSGDGSHPSLTGSYLAAAVFYLVLTEQSDFVAPAPAPIPEADAGVLRDIARGVVTQR